MKTLHEVIKQDPVFLGEWYDRNDVLEDFDLPKEQYQDINILFAFYGLSSYEGDAFVLLERNGSLHEVNGSHCSCYGLEGQWSEEDTCLQALNYRLMKGELGHSFTNNEFHNELCEFIGINPKTKKNE